MKFITAARLVKANACHDQVRLFRQTFGPKAHITAENLDKAEALELDIWWLERFLSPTLRDAYDAACKPHRETYEAACKPLRDAYDAACKMHRDAYDAACKMHWDAYDAACMTHFDAFLAARKTHRDAYDAACKTHLLTALLED